MRNERERWQKRGVLGDADKVFQVAEKLEVILATSLPEESLIYYEYAKYERGGFLAGTCSGCCPLCGLEETEKPEKKAAKKKKK